MKTTLQSNRFLHFQLISQAMGSEPVTQTAAHCCETPNDLADDVDV
jgi:hypothetical protein